jgi:hypothetical protein
MRVPASRVKDVRRFLERGDNEPTCPLYGVHLLKRKHPDVAAKEKHQVK